MTRGVAFRFVILVIQNGLELLAERQFYTRALHFGDVDFFGHLQITTQNFVIKKAGYREKSISVERNNKHNNINLTLLLL